MIGKILKKNKVFTIVLILTLLALGLWSSLFYVLTNKATVLAEKNRQLNQLRNYQSNAVSLKSVISQTASARQMLAEYFYDQDSIVDFIEAVESLATETGVLAQFLNIETDQGFSATLEAEGSFLAMTDFLQRLETGPFMIRFNQVLLSEEPRFDEAGNESLVWVVHLDITLLSFDAKNNE